ncbi:MAG: glucosyltransferase domain-containing protein [Streptococcaceae bacterium]|jgi:hypothetical protein|nr:glucosyltransferase domain-containing protein [Streptococcaceae bacterium]
MFNYYKEKKTGIITLLIIYLSTLVPVGFVNFPYIDDNLRRANGIPNFGAHYSRWVSEIASWVVQGSRRVTDLGLTTFILSAFILTVTSVLFVYVLVGKKATILSFILSSIIGLNPWFLNAVAFRFDTPYISLSLLFSVLPFLWWKKEKRNFVIFSTIGLFCMYNTYQASSGIYLVLALLMLLTDFLNGKEVKNVVLLGLYSLLSFFLGTVLYMGQLQILPATANETSQIMKDDYFSKIVTNLHTYFSTIYHHSARIWIFMSVVSILCFAFSMLYQVKIAKKLAFGYLSIYFILSAIASFGIYIFLENPIAPDAPRYNYGFAVWLISMFILASTQIRLKPINILKNVVFGLFSYYLISFVFVFSSMLHIQKDIFEHQSIMLAQELTQIYEPGDQVFIQGFLRDSEVFKSTTRNYPILSQIVPSNIHSTYFNQLWFSQATGMPQMNATPVGFDAQSYFKGHETRQSNFRFDIYKIEQTIYVITK